MGPVNCWAEEAIEAKQMAINIIKLVNFISSFISLHIPTYLFLIFNLGLSAQLLTAAPGTLDNSSTYVKQHFKKRRILHLNINYELQKGKPVHSTRNGVVKKLSNGFNLNLKHFEIFFTKTLR